MTPPAPKAPSSSEGAPGTARWLNMVTTMVVGAAVLVVGVAAAPSLLRAAVSSASDPQDFAPPVRAQNPMIVPGDHPHTHPFDADDGPPDETDGPDTPSPTDPRFHPPRFPGDTGAEPGPGFDDLGLKGGVLRRPLSLRDRRTGTAVQDLRAGEKVHILREDGDWVLVVKGGEADLVTGWARRSELLIR